MSVHGLVAAVLALGLFLWLAAVYLPVARKGPRLTDRRDRDAAAPAPIPADRSGKSRPRGEVNPAATLRLA